MGPPSLDNRAAAGGGAALDLLFLTCAIGASTLAYIGALGFYHDDYHFLGLLSSADDQSLGGLLEAFRDGVPKQNLRPAQEVLFAGLYDLFGAEPLPWHLVSTGLLVAMGATLYLLLRELLLSRAVAVAIALLYAVLPHYATARFWPATFAELLSMALLFVSLYSVLRAARARPLLQACLWVALAVGTLAVSVLAYEVAMPLFLLTPALLVYRHRRAGEPSLRRSAIVGGPYAVALLSVFAWKLAEAREIGRVTGYDLGYPDGFAYHLAYLGQGILRVNAGSYGLGLPYVVGWVLTNQLSWVVLALAVTVGAGSFAYLGRLPREAASLPDARSSLRLLATGLVVLVLGYAVFLTNSEILFRSAGADNRVAIAAALGVAVAVIGGVAWLAGRVGRGRADVVFRGLVATLVAVGTLLVGTLGDYWAEAWTRQQAILNGIRSELPPEPRDVTVILDGTCPEVGPAVVFVSTTDLTGALQTAYREPSVQARVVRDELAFTGTAARITNTFLGRVSSVLVQPYGPGLSVYDASSGQLFPLRDAADARRYRAHSPQRPECPPVRSFAWGIDIERWRIFA